MSTEEEVFTQMWTAWDEYLHFYRAKFVRVIDGDTVEMEVDLGFNIKLKEIFRLTDIDAPEVKGEERPQGLDSKNFLINLLNDATKDGNPMFVSSEKHGKFRWLGTIFIGGVSVNDIMVENGYAKPYTV